MGQYYAAILMNKKGRSLNTCRWYGSWDFDCGSKLMEHSYIGNWFTNEIAHRIYKNPMRVMWCGDYTKKEDLQNTIDPSLKVFIPLDYDVDAKNGVDWNKEPGPFGVAHLVRHGKSLYLDACKATDDENGEFKWQYVKSFLVNHTQKVYVDMEHFYKYCSRRRIWYEQVDEKTKV